MSTPVPEPSGAAASVSDVLAPLRSSMPEPAAWNPLRRVLFRFGFVYWLLFIVPMITTQVDGLDWIGDNYSGWWSALVVWVGKHVLHVGYHFDTDTNGSGDKTSDYINIFCFAVMALLATVLWSLVDRRAREHERLRGILRVAVRHSLAFVMVGYGISKVFAGQFPPPSSNRLLQPYGESSPMGLLWTFMGTSPAYVVFSGLAETVGALLLLFRRTTTLGALILAAVLTNVVMLNFCYDVPVKINSSHYLAMCILLLLPVARRLVEVVVLERAAPAVPARPALPRRWMRVARLVLKYGSIVLVLSLSVNSALEGRAMRAGASKRWFDGYWTVESFVRDGQDVPALITDASRWKRIGFGSRKDKIYFRWRPMDDSMAPLYTGVIDDTKQSMTLTPDGAGAPGQPLVLHFVRDGDDHLTLDGTIGANKVVVKLARLSTEKMLLVNRGFHWINEVPYNR